MELNKTLLKKNYRILYVIIVSFILAFVFSSLNGNLHNIIEDYSIARGENIVRRIYLNEDISAYDYFIDNHTYVSQSIDPQLVIKGINEYVGSIDIFFEKPIVRDIPIEVFWGIEGEGFVAQRIKTTTALEGTDKISISLKEKVTDLRIDIGTSKDISFELSSVVINDEMSQTLIGRLIKCMKESMSKRSWFDRFQILLGVISFVLIHLVIDIKKMYEFLFDKRWIVAGILLLFMVVNKYHGDSITCFDQYVQPGMGSDYIYPIIGQERSIRSDEWLTGTPINLSTQYLENPYGQYNYLARGTNTVNNSMITILSILNPVSLVQILIRVVFGYEYAYSFGWYVNIFLTFLFQLELFLIISSRQKLLSVCGTCMVVLSSHYLWWNFPQFILYSSVALVCAYYFFCSDTLKKRIIFAYGVAVGAALFVLMLYPAWEVPMGFYSLIVFAWIVHECWDNIKRMPRTGWIIVILAFVLFVLMVATNMIAQREYMESITNTVYPGARISYGGFSIMKLFNYIAAVLFPYVDYGNPSESGMYITLFPIPIIVAFYVLIKKNRKNWLLNGLVMLCIFLGLYTTVGLPSTVAKITLMTSSTPNRCADILGYIQVVLFVVVMAEMKLDDKMSIKKALIFSLLMSGIAIILANRSIPEYMSNEYMIIFFELLSFVFFCCMAKVNGRMYNIGLVTIILIAMVTGICIRPICKGTDAIYSKPVAKEIQQIAAEDRSAKWIACDTHVTPQFALACGASVINSVNRYPNMALWEKLDPDKSNEYIYNRYTHMIISFIDGDTSMELIQDDLIHLYLSYGDMEKTQVKYILSLHPLNVNNQYVVFNEIYNTGGAYIYQVEY